MSYTVIIPSRNPENAGKCIAALRIQGYSGRIIVVDDSDEEPYNDVILDPLTRAGFICGVKPFCFARNVNLGIQAAGADDVFLLNDDALLLPNTYGSSPHGMAQVRWPCSLDALVRAHEVHSEFGIIGATVRGPAWPVQVPRKYPDLYAAHPPGGCDLLTVREVPGLLPFVAVYIPRRTIELVGLLDERFEPGGCEDDDYCRRVRNAGLKVGIYDGCTFDHQTLPHTFRPEGQPDLYNLPLQRQRYFEKWGEYPK